MGSAWKDYPKQSVSKLAEEKKGEKDRKAAAEAARKAEEQQAAGQDGARKAPKAPPCYYDSGRKAFWSQNAQKEWIELNESGVRRLLKFLGFSGAEGKDTTISQVERAMFNYQNQHNVHCSIALAGWPIGVHEICGSRVLVPRERRKVTPREGNFASLQDFIEQLLGKQKVFFQAWLKSALEALEAGAPFRRGQALAIAGPAGCGKSLLQSVITEVFGGRVAKPYAYLVGETGFNGEMLEAEHLAIEDEAASTDLRTRRHFGAQLKNLIANDVQRLHAKGRQAIAVEPFWRVSISLNDEPENLMVLPPLDESLRDKIIILKASPVKFPWDGENSEARKRYRETLSEQVPAYLWWLKRWKIPEKIRDQRYGVKAVQNPELLESLESLAPEYKLLGLIDQLAIWEFGKEEWEGTAADLERALRLADKGGEVGRLLTFNTACGVYLSRLERRYGERFSCRRVKGKVAIWTIKRNPEG